MPLARLVIVLLVSLAVAGTAPAQPSDAWFEVERLNPGLGPPPETLERSTPQGAMESFLDLTRAGRYEEAAHLLDLSRIPQAEQAERGPELARRLADVIESTVWIDWDNLPDRPDALATGPDGDALAGQMRRSLQMAILEVGRRPVPLRLNRLKPPGGDPVWVFSRQSVGNVDALHRVYGPGWFQGMLPPEWRRQTVASLQRWELVGLPVALLAAVAVFLLLRGIFGALARLAPWRTVVDAARAARTPMAILAAFGLLQYATHDVISFSAPIATVLSPVLITGMVIAVTMALLRATDSVLDMVTRRYVGEIDDSQSADERHFYTSIYAFRRIILLVAVVAGVGIVLMQLHLFETLGMSLLASAGVVTVILGIAGQTVLGNILASLQIAIAKPIRIGDSVMYEDRWAYVESIYYTFVRLRTWDDRRLIVPVQYFISKPFENLSMIDAKMTRTFELVLDPRADTDALRRVFLDVAKEDEDVLQDELLSMLVMGQDHTGMTVTFYVTANDPSIAWTMHARLRERMLDWIRRNHPEWWPRQRELEERPGNTLDSAAE